MKTALDYSLNAGTCSLKYYKFYTVGIGTYKTKSKIIEALNLGIEVLRLDRIMNTVSKWNGERWEHKKQLVLIQNESLELFDKKFEAMFGVTFTEWKKTAVIEADEEWIEYNDGIIFAGTTAYQNGFKIFK